MTFIICEPCIGTKDPACVDACPVDCIHPRADEPDFEPEDWLLDTKGRAALACGKTGEFALIKGLGLDLAVRRFHAGEAKIDIRDKMIVLHLKDAGLPATVLAGESAALWARKLSSEEYI